MNRYFRNEYRDEQGSTLISTLLLLLFLTFLMTGAATVIKHQVVQYKQTAHSYEAKALIEMTERLLLNAEDDNYPRHIQFNNGKTVVEQVSEHTYKISARLNSEYTSQKTIELPVKEEVKEDEEYEELEVERLKSDIAE